MNLPPMAFWDLEMAYASPLQAQKAKELFDNGGGNIWDLWPFGISVGSIKFSDRPCPDVWYDVMNGVPMSAWIPETTNAFVGYLNSMHRLGYKMFTLNGTGFDWQLLYKLTGNDECKRLCLDSYDPAFQALCMLGFPVGLEAFSQMAGGPPKEMDGAAAPTEWMAGNYDLVIRYVAGDAIRLEMAIMNIIKHRGLPWITKSGGLRYKPLPKGLMTVRQCLDLPLPDTSWMDEPMTRESFISWMED